MKKETIMKGGLGSHGRVSGTCNCPGCKKIQKERSSVLEIEKKLQSQISIIRESVEHSITRLQNECNETVQRLKKDAAEKIKQIKNKKGGD